MPNEYVKDCRHRGYSDAQIRQQLINQGWSDAQIKKALKPIKVDSNHAFFVDAAKFGLKKFSRLFYAIIAGLPAFLFFASIIGFVIAAVIIGENEVGLASLFGIGLIVGIGLFLLMIPSLILIYGYQIRIFNAVFNGADEVPKFGAIGDVFKTGFFFGLVWFIYMIGFNFIAVPLMFIPYVGALFSNLLSFVFGMFLLLTVVPHYAKTRDFGEAFNISLFMKLISENGSDFFRAVLEIFLISLVMYISFIFIITIPFALAWCMYAICFVGAKFYMKAVENTK